MSFNLTPKQALAYLFLTDNKTTEIGFGGAAGGGKSYLGCFWIVQTALKYPGTTHLIGRKELTNLKKTTFISLFKVLSELGIRPEELFKVNSQTNIINFHNGSVIFLMDTAYNPSDPLYTRFGGLELTDAFIDESNETPEEAIAIIKTRIGRGRNKEYNLTPKLLETFNPSKEHVYRRFYMPSKNKTLPKHMVFIPSLAFDNPHLPAEYIKQLENADKITKERLLYGNFEYDDDPTKLFEYDRILRMFELSYTPVHKEQKYLTVDVARFGEDKTIIVLWDNFFVRKVWVKTKASTYEVENAIKEIQAKERILWHNIVIDEDGIGGGVVDHLPGCRGFVNGSKPLEPTSGPNTSNYANLKSQCYFLLADYVNNLKIGITKDIDPTAKKLIIEDLEQIKKHDADKDRKLQVTPKEDIKKNLGRSPDFGDALMMRMLFILKKPVRPYWAN